MSSDQLKQLLQRIDGRPYPAYKDLRGSYKFDRFTLTFDRIQGDPFAAPSRLSLEIPHTVSGLEKQLFSTPSRRTGTENALALAFSNACRDEQQRNGSGKSGLINIDRPQQEILERTCVQIGESSTHVSFVAGLPASGRRILGRAAVSMFFEHLPHIVQQSLVVETDSKAENLLAFANTNEDADALRDSLAGRKLVAFVADGAILPRASGADQRPLKNAIPFAAPESLTVSFDLPNAGSVSGMGIPEGITLIVGGGYHGKSTLLNALERGIYNHRPSDGRERVVARNDALKVRAEDGRSVASVNLSPFINNLPGGKSTTSFSTENASGSTSQAAAIIEALESESTCLLIDEDISATNFLIRDARMQKLVAPEKEPITPLSHRIEELRDSKSVSTIMVLGGSSDYFESANLVIGMENYIPVNLTEKAKQLCSDSPPSNSTGGLPPFTSAQRQIDTKTLSPYKEAPSYRGNRPSRDRGYDSRPPKKNIKSLETRALVFGTETIDLTLISQLVDEAQTRTIGAILEYALDSGLFDRRSAVEAIKLAIDDISRSGLRILKGNDLAMVRHHEVIAAINRHRSIKILNT